MSHNQGFASTVVVAAIGLGIVPFLMSYVIHKQKQLQANENEKIKVGIEELWPFKERKFRGRGFLE